MEIIIAEYLKMQGGGRIQIPKPLLEQYNIEKGDLIWIGKGELVKKKGEEDGKETD